MLHFHTVHSEGITGLRRGECLSALVKTGGKRYLVLTRSLIHAQPRLPRSFSWSSVPFTFPLDAATRTVHSAPAGKIDCAAKRASVLQNTGLQPSLTWIERYEDERIGCTETVSWEGVGGGISAGRGLNMFTFSAFCRGMAMAPLRGRSI